MRIVPAAVEPVGVGFNLGAVAMGAPDRLLRWLGISATLGSGFESTVPRRGVVRWLLPALMLGVMPLVARAQDQFRTEVNPDGTLTVNKVSPNIGQGCPSGVLTIPEAIGGRRVTSIGRQAFRGSGLRSVVIGDGVRYLGNAAFAYAPLIKVVVPGSVTFWEDGHEDPAPLHLGMLAGCYPLQTVTLRDRLKSHG